MKRKCLKCGKQIAKPAWLHEHCRRANEGMAEAIAGKAGRVRAVER